ncbi:MAG: hypothetical protein ACOC5D_00815 [Thermoplasmatota archaeon]
MEDLKSGRLSKKEKNWRKFMAHPKDKDDFDRDTAWDMIGILTIAVLVEAGIIIALLVLIIFNLV